MPPGTAAYLAPRGCPALPAPEPSCPANPPAQPQVIAPSPHLPRRDVPAAPGSAAHARLQAADIAAAAGRLPPQHWALEAAMHYYSPVHTTPCADPNVGCRELLQPAAQAARAAQLLHAMLGEAGHAAAAPRLRTGTAYPTNKQPALLIRHGYCTACHQPCSPPVHALRSELHEQMRCGCTEHAHAARRDAQVDVAKLYLLRCCCYDGSTTQHTTPQLSTPCLETSDAW